VIPLYREYIIIVKKLSNHLFHKLFLPTNVRQ